MSLPPCGEGGKVMSMRSRGDGGDAKSKPAVGDGADTISIFPGGPATSPGSAPSTTVDGGDVLASDSGDTKWQHSTRFSDKSYMCVLRVNSRYTML